MLTNWVFITKTSILTSLHLYIYNFGIILPRKETSTYRYITYTSTSILLIWIFSGLLLRIIQTLSPTLYFVFISIIQPLRKHPFCLTPFVAPSVPLLLVLAALFLVSHLLQGRTILHRFHGSMPHHCIA